MGKKKVFDSKKPPPEGLKVVSTKPPERPEPKVPKDVKEDSGGSRTHSSQGSRTDLSDLDHESESEVLMKKTHDLETLTKVIEEYQSLMASRKVIAEKNMKPNYDEFEKLRSNRKLDANIKKCTNFVKKLKGFTGSQFDQIEKEFQGLNLSNYISEIATALTETRFKISDIQNVVNLYSMFHLRYREFNAFVLEIYRKILMPRKADFTASVVSKLPVDIRIFGELMMCGLFDVDEGFTLVQNSIKNIISNDKEGMQYISPIILFCRGLGCELAGLVPKNIRQLCEEHQKYLPENTLIPQKKKDQLKQMLINYYQGCCEEVVKCHENVLLSEMQNRKFLKTRGEIPDDRQTTHAQLKIIFDSSFAVLKKFASYMDKGLPGLRKLEADPEAEHADDMLRLLNEVHGDASLPAGLLLFEDEETRAFYQNLPDLKVYLPQIVYRDNILKAAEQTAEIERREKELANVDEELEAAQFSEKTEEEAEAEASDTADALPSEQNEVAEDEKAEVIKPSFQFFLDRLLRCFNSSMIDQAAKDFVDNFNTRPNRKRLVKTLFRIPWHRADLVPLWARLVAILAPVMPDVQLELCEMLLKDFRYLVRKRDQIFIETKLKIVRFIGELVNFGIFPKSDAFKCFKTLLMNFTHHQIEMACKFMETCGRFLHRNVDSHRRMQIYIEEFLRRKTVGHLDPRYVNMVDHAYSLVCPKEAGPRKKPPLMKAFIKHVIYDTLQRSNLKDSIKVMRSLNWKDRKVVKYFVEVMSQPWNLKFQQYSVSASLLAAIMPHRGYVPAQVVDNLLEGIFQMIGSTHPRYNSQRVSMIMFLGECYNYRLVGSSEIFTVLYALISHQVVLDHNYMNPCDPPDNVFRVRMVCTLLKVCGMYFNHGNGKKKLNCYLKYFMRYYWFKKTCPVWTEFRKFPFVINDLLDETIQMLRPRMKLPVDFEAACKEVFDMEERLRKTYFGDGAYNDNKYQLHDIPEDEPYERESPNFAETDFDNYPRDPSPTPEMDAEGNEVVTTSNWEKFKPSSSELAEFDAQMERLSVDCSGRQAKADIPVPLKTSPVKGSTKSSEKPDEGVFRVALLTKKGNKQQLKHIEISGDTEFVKRITASQKAEEQERLRIKQLTLGINRRQQEEEALEVVQKVQAAFKSKPKPTK